uniref:Uncharacterized protein n=1 Tax=viral metagenome TaxID=1070528 RepID=A0A6C0EBD7_9ZZZZ
MNNMQMMGQMYPQMASGTGDGTSIAALRNDYSQVIKKYPQMQMPQNNPTQQQLLQLQQMQQLQQQQQQQYEDSQKTHINNLVNDINRDLEKYQPSKSRMTETDSTDTEDNKTESWGSYVPNFIKEPILLLLIYLILSQEFVRQYIAKYVTYLEPKNGSVPVTGIVIYGIILTVLFTFFKKILLR